MTAQPTTDHCPAATGWLLNPFELATQANVTIFWRDLPDGLRGVTDGLSKIWLDMDLTYGEIRSTLLHELIHVRERHIGTQSAQVEAEVRREVADRLAPPTLLALAVRARHWAEGATDRTLVIAEFLGTDELTAEIALARDATL